MPIFERNEETTMANVLWRLWNEEEGQDLTEYALLLVLLSLAAIGSLSTIAGAINNVFSKAAGNLNTWSRSEVVKFDGVLRSGSRPSLPNDGYVASSPLRLWARTLKFGGVGMKSLLVRLWKDEQGQDLTEYALLLVLLSLAAIGSLNQLAQAVNGVFQNAASNLST
jgi:pilus assembly protein Flp/PilA